MSRCEHYGNQAEAGNPPHWHQCTKDATLEFPQDGLYCDKHGLEIAEEENLTEGTDYYKLKS